MNVWLKTQHKQQEDNSMDDICYLENICRNEQPFILPKLADKLALSNMNLTLMEVGHVLAC